MESSENIETPVSLREGAQGVWRHMREYKGTIISLSILGVVSAIANGAVPYVTGRFFDSLIALSQGTTLVYSGLPLWGVLLGTWALILIISDAVDWWIDGKQRWLGTNLQIGTQAEGFIHVLQLSLSFHTNEHINGVFERISAASWRMSEISRTIIQIGPQILSVLIGVAFAFSINTPLASILMLGLLVYAIVLSILLRGTAERDSIAHRRWNDSWNDAAAAASQATSVKQAAAETYEIRRIDKTMRNEAAGLWYANELVWNRINFWQRTIVFLTQFSVFIFSVYYIRIGAITIGELVALNSYAGMFFGPLVTFGSSWQIIRNGFTSAGRVNRIFTQPTENYHPKNSHTSGSTSGTVTFDDVTFNYEAGQEPVLTHFSFEAKPGESVAFVGESGVGKSTAVSLISAYYFPNEGRVTVDGVDTRQWDLTALRSRIAVVPQEVALFNDTIRTNIRYGTFDASDAAVEAAAREAHIHDFIMKQPAGYDTIVGERGIKLSVGQKQRLAIARAILRNPEFLILDEPTSALDPETEQLVTESLQKLMKGRTTFIIAHRLSTVRHADHILVVKDGTIAEQGSHATLMRITGGVYRHLYELHVGLHE
ncbi:MAG: ABC transporter ATP-binding protein [Candidatus Pacebacteria bacterium]|nr:ABC transporter ATP-binding protein [Candidatus Paceibacterota bacterium]